MSARHTFLPEKRIEQSSDRRLAVSIAGYVVVLGNTWEFAIVTSVFSVYNGGPAGAIWTTIIVCIGMFLVVLSMAEIASMAPTSGGKSSGG